MPEDIQRILRYVADYAKGYDNHMKWNEEAKLKSDMMLRMDRWRLVTTEEIEDECRALGMREEGVRAIRDTHAKCMQERRLVPARSYRDFEFNHGDRPAGSRR